MTKLNEQFTHDDHRQTETTITIEVLADECADTSYLDQEGWEDRKSQLERGVFDFIGVRVRITRHNWQTGNIQQVTSAGLWGIESDCGTEYIRTTAQDEWAALWSDSETAQTLNSWLITEDAINAAEIKQGGR